MHFVIFLWQLLWGIWAMMYIPLKPVQLSGICVGNHSQSTLSLCTQSKPIKTNSHPFVLVQIMSLSFLDFIWPQSALSLLFSLVLHQRRVFAESVGGFWVRDLSEGHRINFILWAAPLFLLFVPSLYRRFTAFTIAHCSALQSQRSTTGVWSPVTTGCYVMPMQNLFTHCITY